MCAPANSTYYSNLQFTQVGNGPVTLSFTLQNLQPNQNYSTTIQWGGNGDVIPTGTQKCAEGTDANGNAAGGVVNLPSNIFYSPGAIVVFWIQNPDGTNLWSDFLCSDLLTMTPDPSITPTSGSAFQNNQVGTYDNGLGYLPNTAPTGSPTPAPAPAGCPEVPTACWYPWV